MEPNLRIETSSEIARIRAETNRRTNIALGLMTAAFVVVGATALYMNRHIQQTHQFPIHEVVETGVPKPQDLEIKVLDLNKNGPKEVYLTYQGQDYNLTVNPDNTLQLRLTR
ncbi:MAG: hypothetical protein Q7R96_02110 [Nanoarchaeota archaeon]|nr:hypothetical protein [Nanoarchaeota archaeon]